MYKMIHQNVTNDTVSNVTNLCIKCTSSKNLCVYESLRVSIRKFASLYTKACESLRTLQGLPSFAVICLTIRPLTIFIGTSHICN